MHVEIQQREARREGERTLTNYLAIHEKYIRIQTCNLNLLPMTSVVFALSPSLSFSVPCLTASPPFPVPRLTLTVGPSSGKNTAAALSRPKRSNGAAATRSTRDTSNNRHSPSTSAASSPYHICETKKNGAQQEQREKQKPKDERERTDKAGENVLKPRENDHKKYVHIIGVLLVTCRKA